MFATVVMMEIRAVNTVAAPHTPDLHQGNCSLKTVHNQMDYHIHLPSLHPSVSNASGSSFTSGQLPDEKKDIGEIQILEMSNEDIYRSLRRPLPQDGSQD